MEIEKNWIYYNIHDLIGIRLQKDNPSKRSFDLFFGPFRTNFLEESKIDISVQNSVPEISGCRDVYLRKYKVNLLKTGDFWILAGQRDLLLFIHPVLQMICLRKKHCMIHSASVAINGRGVLLPACGGTGKTSAVISILREIGGSSFLSDDFSFISQDLIYSNPKAFSIYPYHRQLFPHLFKTKHKFLIPSCFSNIFEKMHTIFRPAVMAFPRLENIAKRVSPEFMQVPARQALADFEFSDKAKINTILFLERYSGDKTVLEDICVDRARQRLTSNWLHEIGKCSQEMITAMSGAGIIDLTEYYSQMGAIIDAACQNRTVKLFRLPKMLPQETGRTVVTILKEIMKAD